MDRPGRGSIRVPRLDRPLDIADRQPTFWARVEAGTWEPGLLALLADRLRPGTTFIDLGAWVGPTSLIAAAHEAQVIALEADPAAIDQFQANLAANPDIARKVALLPVAISAHATPLRMAPRRKPGDSMSSALLAGADGTWTVPAITPADLAVLCANAADVVIKLDIEGGEYDILPAMAPLLAPRHAGPTPDLVISFHQRELIAARGAQLAARMTREALTALGQWWGTPVTDDWNPERPGDPIAAAGIAQMLLDDPGCPDTWLLRCGGSFSPDRA
jgi:FkbM family methyltransferase